MRLNNYLITINNLKSSTFKKLIMSEKQTLETSQEKKEYVRRSFNDYTFLQSFLSGGMAGSISKTIIAPMDRVKLIFMVR